MNRFYLLLLCPLFIVSCKKETTQPGPVLGTGNVSFLSNDNRYDSVYVRKNYIDFKGANLLSGYLTHVRDNEAAMVLKTGSYSPATSGALRLEFVSEKSLLKLGKNFLEPTIVGLGNTLGIYKFFPPDSSIYYEGYTRQTEKPVAYKNEYTELIPTAANTGKAQVGYNRQAASIGPQVTRFYNNNSFVEEYPTIPRGTFIFDRDGNSDNHRAYWFYFDKSSKNIEVDAMHPGTPAPPIPGGPKVPEKLFSYFSGIGDSAVYFFLNAQQFENNNYVIGINWTNPAGRKFMNIYTLDMNADPLLKPFFENVASNIPMEEFLPQPYFYAGPENLAFHFLKNGGLYLSRQNNVGNSKDIFKLNGSSFEQITPSLSDNAVIYSALSSESYLWLTVGNGTSRVEIIRTKKN